MTRAFWLAAGTASLFLAACRPPAPSDRAADASRGESRSFPNQEGTATAEEASYTVPPADVSHGEAPIGGPQADPAPVDALLAPAERTRLHQIRLDVQHTPVTIAQDVRYAAWTFGGTVPGPVLHVRQGDTVDFKLVNRANIPHSMDFHAAEIAPNKFYVNVLPGDSLHYRFVARVPGAFMYHCGTAPAAMHIANGMYGALIVDPVVPRPKARELVLHSKRVLPDAEAGGGRNPGARLGKAPEFGARPRRLQWPGGSVRSPSNRGHPQRAASALCRQCRTKSDQLFSRGGRNLRARFPGWVAGKPVGWGPNRECSRRRWKYLRATAARAWGLPIRHPRIRGRDKGRRRGAAGTRS